jgi:TolB-like protein/Tfp pilus assembly protein PilF
MLEYWKQLGQRKMAQWALAYAAAAWIALQVIGLAASSYGWPPLVMRAALGIAVIGFLAALVLAWYHGERGQQKTSSTELLILAVWLAVGGGVLWNSERGHPESTAATAGAGAARPAAVAAKAAIDPRSIAVLPFANLRADKDNAYFAEGIQDEILTRLSKVAELKVISRTSTLRYASRPENLSQIARELGVANILEGSVQKVGNSVRINVQLIRAASDTHLWAEIYDRELVDIFSIQSEVTSAIAKQLQATLTADEQRVVAAKPTANTAAYEAYLRGLAAERQTEYSRESILQARRYYQQAVQLDPDFAEAWRRLAQAISLYYSNEPDRGPADLAAMREAAAAVARLKPDSGDAWLAQGYYRYRGLRDRPGALQAFARAAAREPNNADTLSAMAYVERRLGNMPQALAHVARAQALDPGNPNLWTIQGEFLAAVRRFPEARAAFARALQMQPGNLTMLAKTAQTYQAEGDVAAAQRVLDGIPAASKDFILQGARRQQAWLRGQPERVVAECAALLAAEPASNTLDAADRIGCQLDSAEAQRAQGQSAAAVASCKSALARLQQPDMAALEELLLQSARGQAQACLGHQAEALGALRRAIELLAGDAKETPDAELALARVQVQFGDKAAALAILKRSLAVPYGTTAALLRLDPRWAPLRGDARFQALLRTAP